MNMQLLVVFYVITLWREEQIVMQYYLITVIISVNVVQLQVEEDKILSNLLLVHICSTQVQTIWVIIFRNSPGECFVCHFLIN